MLLSKIFDLTPQLFSSAGNILFDGERNIGFFTKQK
jgi:hypothetical protein